MLNSYPRVQEELKIFDSVDNVPQKRHLKSIHLNRVVLTRIESPAAPPYGTQPVLDSSEEVYKFWRTVVAADPSFEPDKEHLVAVLLDTKLRPKGYYVVSVGALNETIAGPRETFRAAIVGAAYAIILVHNHPSGDPAPSQADNRMTRNMREAAQLIQIQLLDHVIVGETSHYSFREAGVL